ncbi:MAG: 4Fe-4S binding protein [Actinomycetota bacterium]|nr:4Fe-4S binding protein [Actinomycetota bacterium]
MSDEVYERLRELLDRHPTGCTPAPEIIEILKVFFTEEEAGVALGLGFRPFRVEDVARRAGVDEETAERCLESLADKAVVFEREKEGVRGYALLPVMPGLFEFPFMKGMSEEMRSKLTPLWKSYLPKLGGKFGACDTKFSRIIPVQEEVENEPGVLPYQKVYEMIDKARVVGIGTCACRDMERNCDNPLEACMLFDETCTYLVERGFGRYITKEEMKEKLREFDEAGLVHQINNVQENLTFVCNCCTCCCGLLRISLEWGHPEVFSSSGFAPVVDAELCNGCGTCADERCPVQAIEVVDETAVVNDKLCIGCGLCVTGCPNEALRLVSREETAEPPATTSEMGMRILQEKGKLEAFMEVIKP